MIMASYKKQVIHTLFREKPLQMLLYLYLNDGQYVSNISKHVDCTYSHVIKVLDVFHKAGMIEFKKEGRVKKVKLTKKGKEIIKEIKKAVDFIDL